MPGPTITFGFIVATLFGAVFHLILGGDARRLATFLIAGWIGFMSGHLGGVILGFSLFNVGILHFLPACFGALIALIFTQAMIARRS